MVNQQKKTIDTIESLHEWARELGGACCSTKYAGTMSYYTWECGKCDHRWDASWNNVKHHNSWCPKCRVSIRETIVRAAFQENFPNEGFATNRTVIGMELDGYCESQSLAFEHDGIQHRKRVPYFQRNEGDFEAQQQRDARKSELCDNAEITLVRVPDRQKLANLAIRQYVRKELEDLGYDLPKLLTDDATFFASVRIARGKSPYLEKVRQFVENMNGVLLSETCPTRTWPMSVNCHKDHNFMTNYDNLERKRWCPLCAENATKSVSELREKAEARGYQLLETAHRRGKNNRSRRYVTVQCPNDHEPTEILWSNFRKGRGCKICGSNRTGASKRCSIIEIQKRLLAVKMTIEGEYCSINKPLIFICESEHKFTSTLNKVEKADPEARCPQCKIETFDDVELLDNYGPETSMAKTKLRWCCRTCETIMTTTYRGMRIRKYRCSNKKCQSRL